MQFQEILDRFSGVVAEHDGFVAICPSHNDSHPSLRITASNGKVLLKCRAGCQTTDVIDAVNLTFGDLNNVEGQVSLIEEVGPLTEEHKAQALAFITDNPLTESAEAYAKARFGVDGHLARDLKLGAYTAPEGFERLIVPFMSPEGEALGWQARAMDNEARIRWIGPRNPQGSAWSKIGYFAGGNGTDEVIVCEGPGDALTAAAAGYDSIAVRGAAQGNIASDIAGWANGRRIVVIGDGDQSGKTFNSNLLSELLDLGANATVMPMREGSDIADWFSESPDTFQREFIRHVGKAQEVSRAEALAMGRVEDIFPLTDLGNARYVAALAQSRETPVRYCPQLGWLIADRGVWLVDELGVVRAIVQETADSVKEIADAWQVRLEELGNAATSEQQQEANRWKAWAKYSQSTRGIDSALTELKALRTVATDISEFDSHDDLLAVGNGVVNLRWGTLIENDEDLLLTRRINVNYNPDARAERWVEFIQEIMSGDQEMANYLQRLVGYGITGRTDEQAFSVLWGTGANGKTVFTATLSHVFEQVTTNTPFSTFEMKSNGSIPNDIAALRGARLVMAAEGEADKPMAESLLKRLTGRDPITARFLHKEFFTFYPNFLMMLATNNKPAFRGQDEGLWRRVKMIEFNRYFAPEERDHRLQDKLMAEAEGILAWAVVGAMVWYEGGLNDPQKIKDATGDYRTNSDPLVGFLPGIYIKDAREQGFNASTLFSDYLDWAQEENLSSREIVTRKKFFAMLEERGLHKRVGTGNKTVFDGVRRFRPSDSEPVEPVINAPAGGADLGEV
jgi:putative DNA primase/helicase